MLCAGREPIRQQLKRRLWWQLRWQIWRQLWRQKRPIAKAAAEREVTELSGREDQAQRLVLGHGACLLTLTAEPCLILLTVLCHV